MEGAEWKTTKGRKGGKAVRKDADPATAVAVAAPPPASDAVSMADAAATSPTPSDVPPKVDEKIAPPVMHADPPAPAAQFVGMIDDEMLDAMAAATAAPAPAPVAKPPGRSRVRAALATDPQRVLPPPRPKSPPKRAHEDSEMSEPPQQDEVTYRDILAPLLNQRSGRAKASDGSVAPKCNISISCI